MLQSFVSTQVTHIEFCGSTSTSSEMANHCTLTDIVFCDRVWLAAYLQFNSSVLHSEPHQFLSMAEWRIVQTPQLIIASGLPFWIQPNNSRQKEEYNLTCMQLMQLQLVNVTEWQFWQTVQWLVGCNIETDGMYS